MGIGIYGQEFRFTILDKTNGYIYKGIKTVNSKGETIKKIQPVFDAVYPANDNGFRHAICKYYIPKDGSHKPRHGAAIPVVLCVDKDLETKFIFPTGTWSATPFENGISVFYTAYDDIEKPHNAGAIDTLGKVIYKPEYDDCWVAGDNVLAYKISEDIELDSDRHISRLQVKNIKDRSKTATFDIILYFESDFIFCWDGIMTNYRDIDYKDIDNMEVSPDKKSFYKGQYHILNMKLDKAAKYFDKLRHSSDSTISESATYNLMAIKSMYNNKMADK